MQLTTTEKREHHVTVPKHGAVRIGTLHRILAEVAEHFETSVDEVRGKLFGGR
jgi:hypothetical protein